MIVAVSLGSNLGDRLANLQAMAEEMQGLSDKPIRKSKVYETTPVHCPPDSPKFLNAVVEVELDDAVSPHGLLRKLKAIEAKLGRKAKRVDNEPRPIDLDLIYCGNLQVNTPDLVLPHPRAHLRRFVLQPLSDLSPNLVLPGQTESVRDLLARLQSNELVTLLRSDW